jgi:hypothetical protein
VREGKEKETYETRHGHLEGESPGLSQKGTGVVGNNGVLRVR